LLGEPRKHCVATDRARRSALSEGQGAEPVVVPVGLRLIGSCPAVFTRISDAILVDVALGYIRNVPAVVDDIGAPITIAI